MPDGNQVHLNPVFLKCVSESLISKFTHGSLCIRHSGLCAFKKSCGFLGTSEKPFPLGRRGVVGLMVTRAQSWCSLPGGRCHALLICESPWHPHRAWHRFLVPLRGCQPERRGWAARVAAHVEQGSVAGGWSVWRRSADTRRALGSGCYPESDGASARIRTEEQCLSAEWRGSRSFAEHHERGTEFLPVPQRPLRTLLSNGRGALGPGFFQEPGLLSALTYPKMHGAALWGRGQLGSLRTQAQAASSSPNTWFLLMFSQLTIS